jgi:hypothetical protein
VCWRDDGEERAESTEWKLSMENLHSGKHCGFANISEVVAFLQVEPDKPENLLAEIVKNKNYILHEILFG